MAGCRDQIVGIVEVYEVGLSEVAVKYGASTSVKLRYIIVLQNLDRRVSYKT